MQISFIPNMCNLNWHCVIYGVESWSGVLEWSHGVESWSGFLSGFWSGMKSDLQYLLPFLDRIGFL